MDDTNDVVPVLDYKASVSHTQSFNLINECNESFSEINNYYCNTKRIGKPVYRLHSLKSLLERLNSINTNEAKDKSITLLKGIYNSGTSGQYCVKGAPFLFFDIDVKNTPKKKENAHLFDKKLNADVFDQLKQIAVLVWRSASGNGIAGILYVPQFKHLLNGDKKKHLVAANSITDYLTNHLKINADFDLAQNKFRQVRYLAKQSLDRELNLKPYVFTYELKEVQRVSQNGVKQLAFLDRRSHYGTIQQQYNSSTTIQNALLSNNFKDLGNNRYLHPSTTSKSTGVAVGDVFFNHSTSFSQHNVFTPFWLDCTLNYKGDYKRFIDDLKSKGYKEVAPTKEVFKQAKKTITNNAKDRHQQIFKACYDLVNASYNDKIKFVNTHAKDDAERIVFFDYLKLKPLTITYNKSVVIKKYVSEQINNILDYADQHNKVIVTAETGTGKTTAFINNFTKLRPNCRLLFLAPLTAIVNQLQAENPNLICLTGKSEPQEHAQAKNKPFVVSTYEQGYKHLKTNHSFDYVVVDEAHNLITVNSYKSEVVRNITSVLNGVKIIGLTGTTNYLFKSLGYKLMQIKKEILTPVNVIMRIDNRNSTKIALQHLNNVTGKCLIRLNSVDGAKDLKSELVRQKQYKKNEILILNSSVKESKDFLELCEKSCFNDFVRLVITTAVIDEGLSIKQNGFTDVVFIENQYNPTPESVKQFFARFRNDDSSRKNYYYFKETKDQKLISYNPTYNFNALKNELIQDAGNDAENQLNIANTDSFYYDGRLVNDYYLAYYVSVLFFKMATTKEFINYLEFNYNIKIHLDADYKRIAINDAEIKKDKENYKKLIGSYWLNNNDAVLSVLYRLTSDASLKKTINYTGMNPADDVYNLISTHLKTFETLQKKYIAFESLGITEPNSKLIDSELKPVNNQIVNRELMLLSNLKTIKEPQTKTDQKNKKKMEKFINEVSSLKEFTTKDLLKLWNKQRCPSLKNTSYNLVDLVLHFHSKFVFNSKLKKWC